MILDFSWILGFVLTVQHCRLETKYDFAATTIGLLSSTDLCAACSALSARGV